MAFFAIKVELSELPETMNAMREWLDQHKASLSHFSSTRDAEMVTITVRFDLEDHRAEAFRRRFIPDGEPRDLAEP